MTSYYLREDAFLWSIFSMTLAMLAIRRMKLGAFYGDFSDMFGGVLKYLFEGAFGRQLIVFVLLCLIFYGFFN